MFKSRESAMMGLTAACLAIALIAPRGALAKDGDDDRDDGGGRRCRGLSTEAGVDPSGFPQPQVRRSRHGVLRTTLHACIATNTIVDQPSGATRSIDTPTFEGTIPGPTLSVEPGDKLSILLANGLPRNPPNERGKAFPHDEYTVNLHTHGLTVSPLGMSDNIFRHMDPGTAHQVEVKIPKDHPTGTFWYHPHKHGSVTFQLLGGMAGFLIVKGGPGSLDALLEDAGIKDVVMAFQVIRTTNDGNVAFVHQAAEVFGTDPVTLPQPPTTDRQGIWSTYGIDKDPPLPGKPSFFYYTTNGVTNPHLHMRPGEVQRWRLLNASDGDNLLITLKGHGLNIVAMDGITVEKTYRLDPGDPIVMGPGQRIDVLVKAGEIGSYALQTLDPATDKIDGVACCSVSPYRDKQFPAGIAPEKRPSMHSFDFPVPCSAPGSAGLGSPRPRNLGVTDCSGLSYPVTLATIDVSGHPLDMDLPKGRLPTPKGLPSVHEMLHKKPDAVRHVAFELCGNVKFTSQDPTVSPRLQLPSCGPYYARYGAEYWGGTPFNNLQMLRDDDDKDFKKEGLFDPNQPLFPDMIAGNYEEWTVINRSFSDHPFHMHQNPVLVTKINGITLPTPEWHDTLIVPAAVPQALGPYVDDNCNGSPCPIIDINQNDSSPFQKAKWGSITFRTHFDPVTVGCFVMHCHIINHEDIGMMQRVDVLPRAGESSGCVPESDHAALPNIERLLAGEGKFQICSAVRQSQSISDGRTTPANLSNRLADTGQ